MKGLNKYDAVNDLTLEEYKEIFSLLFKKQVDIDDLSKLAVDMKGVFWSEKFQNLICGKFEIQNVLTKTEFINRLKISKNGKSN